jgi:hypothetical protein
MAGRIKEKDVGINVWKGQMIGYWVGPRAGLIEMMRKFSPPSGIKPQAQRYP